MFSNQTGGGKAHKSNERKQTAQNVNIPKLEINLIAPQESSKTPSSPAQEVLYSDSAEDVGIHMTEIKYTKTYRDMTNAQ